MKVTVNGREYDGATQVGYALWGGLLHRRADKGGAWCRNGIVLACTASLITAWRAAWDSRHPPCTRCFPKGG